MTSEMTRRLRDAIAACDAISDYTAGMDASAFELDSVVRDAVAYRFTVLGEALNRVVRIDESVGLTVPELRQIIGLRNRVVHEYDAIDDEILWDIVQSKLPDLRRHLLSLAEDRG